MKNFTPALLVALFISPNNLAAQTTPTPYGAYRADLEKTLAAMQQNLQTLSESARSCSDFVDKPACPVAGVKGLRAGFIQPVTDDVNEIRNFLQKELAVTEQKLAAGIEKDKLETAGICEGSPDLAIKSHNDKLTALKDAKKKLGELLDLKEKKLEDSGLRIKRAALHQNSKDFSDKVTECKPYVVKIKQEKAEKRKSVTAGLIGIGAAVFGDMLSPKTPFEGLQALVTKDDDFPGCKASAKKSLDDIAENSERSLLAQTIAKLDALKKKIEEDTQKLDALVEKTKPLATRCTEDRNKQQQVKDDANKKSLAEQTEANAKKEAAEQQSKLNAEKAKDSTVKGASADQTVAGDNIKAATPVKDGTTASKEVRNTTPAHESDFPASQTEAAKPLTAPAGKNTASDTAQKVLTYDDLVSGKSELDRTGYQMPAIPEAAEVNISKDSMEIKGWGLDGQSDITGALAAPAAAKPVASSNTASAGADPFMTTDDYKGAQTDMRNKYYSTANAKGQQIATPGNIKLDFNSKKDATYIQNALNAAMKGNSVAVDGKVGSQTISSLSSVMANPDLKKVFLNSLRTQMVRSPASR